MFAGGYLYHLRYEESKVYLNNESTDTSGMEQHHCSHSL